MQHKQTEFFEVALLCVLGVDLDQEADEIKERQFH